MLTQQGYTPDDILPEEKKVNLRRNSTSLRVVKSLRSYQETSTTDVNATGLYP